MLTSHCKETKQFKVDWFGGIYTHIPPSLRPWRWQNPG